MPPVVKAAGQFVILRHEMPAQALRPSHWDFMMESGQALRTWALADEPAVETSIAAMALPDHRVLYLDYEGPVSGDRGAVSRWDRGTFEVVQADEEFVELRLCGARFVGSIVLRKAAGGADHWTARFSSSR